jgi:hypothetical protein
VSENWGQRPIKRGTPTAARSQPVAAVPRLDAALTIGEAILHNQRSPGRERRELRSDAPAITGGSGGLPGW